MLSDAFERLKLKCYNVLSETEDDKFITQYANKNIQSLSRTFSDIRTALSFKVNKANNNVFGFSDFGGINNIKQCKNLSV